MKFFSFWRSLASFRVRIALNLKGIKADVVHVNILKGEQCTDAFRRINPQMLIPALDEGKPPILFQSLAILEYLDETHPNPPLLPKEPKARARVRGIAQIIACDTHPLIVPRVREYLTHEYKIDEPGVMKWGNHWHTKSMIALETNLAGSKQTGKFVQGDQLTIADICLCGQAVGAFYFKVDMAPYPTFKRIVDECNKIDAVARAHPLKQPGAPAA